MKAKLLLFLLLLTGPVTTYAQSAAVGETTAFIAPPRIQIVIGSAVAPIELYFESGAISDAKGEVFATPKGDARAWLLEQLREMGQDAGFAVVSEAEDRITVQPGNIDAATLRSDIITALPQRD
ncbi:MAG: hypothetical protein AAF998_16135 [Bacteroidota bacterium]